MVSMVSSPGVPVGVTEMSWGSMAPRLATILVTCCAQADDMSLDGSFSSKLIPAMNKKRQTTTFQFRNN